MQQELLFWGDYPLNSDETVFGRTSGTGINLSLPVSLTEYCFCWSRRGGAGGGRSAGLRERGSPHPWRHSAIKVSPLVFKANKCRCHQETDAVKRESRTWKSCPGYNSFQLPRPLPPLTQVNRTGQKASQKPHEQEAGAFRIPGAEVTRLMLLLALDALAALPSKYVL